MLSNLGGAAAAECLHPCDLVLGGLKQVIVMIAHADTEKNPNTIQYLQAITPAARQMVAALRSHGVQTLRNLHRCSTSTVVATPQTCLH
jgi:hypothetical protein